MTQNVATGQPCRDTHCPHHGDRNRRRTQQLLAAIDQAEITDFTLTFLAWLDTPGAPLPFPHHLNEKPLDIIDLGVYAETLT